VASLGIPRAVNSGFVQQTLIEGTCPSGSPSDVCAPGQIVRTSTSNAVDWNTSNGWYLDFLSGGERASSDSTLGLGSLLFTTIRPQSSSVSACGAPGADTSASFLYVLNYKTGGAVVGANGVTGASLGSGLVTRPVMIELSDGSVKALIRASTGGTSTASGTDLGNMVVKTPTVNLSSTGNLRRVSWRELTSR
jgi:type IV pilus assembly protein PilY1